MVAKGSGHESWDFLVGGRRRYEMTIAFAVAFVRAATQGHQWSSRHVSHQQHAGREYDRTARVLPCIDFIDMNCEEFQDDKDPTYQWTETVVSLG